MYPNLRKLVVKELLFPDSTKEEITVETAKLYADMKSYRESSLWNAEYMLTMRADQLTSDEREDLTMEIENLQSENIKGIKDIIVKHMYVRVSPFLRDMMMRDAFLDMREDAMTYLAPKLYKAFLADC
jgi:hypothetical protein